MSTNNEKNFDKRALIRVDMQNDFVLPDAPLPVPDALAIIPIINLLSREGRYELVVDTQDWHPVDHLAFASSHPGSEPFDEIELDGERQVLWPVHCVQNTSGAEFHPDLYRGGQMSALFKKGQNRKIHPYSGFGDKTKHDATGLAEFLRKNNITAVDICGVALPKFCVGCTALDAKNEGFKTRIIEDACRAIPNFDYEGFMKELHELGIGIVQSGECTTD